MFCVTAYDWKTLCIDLIWITSIVIYVWVKLFFLNFIRESVGCFSPAGCSSGATGNTTVITLLLCRDQQWSFISTIGLIANVVVRPALFKHMRQVGSWCCSRSCVVFYSVQVHVGTSHQDQRVVGYVTCTHLHAIEGTVCFSSFFLCVSVHVCICLFCGTYWISKSSFCKKNESKFGRLGHFSGLHNFCGQGLFELSDLWLELACWLGLDLGPGLVGMVWVRGWVIHRGDDPWMCVFVRVRVFVYPPQINRYINILVPLLAVPMATGTSWLFKASGRCLPHLFLFIRQDTLPRSLAAILISTYTFWTCKNSGVMTVCKHTSSGLLWPTRWLYGPKIQGPDV